MASSRKVSFFLPIYYIFEVRTLSTQLSGEMNTEIIKLEKIKVEVEKKFGRKIRYAKDCVLLSADINKTTGRMVSASTLKRVWNLISSSSYPSRYTLDSFALYIGQMEEENQSDKKKPDLNDGFISIRSRIFHHLRSAVGTGKERCGIEFDKTIPREDVKGFIEGFVNSDKMLSAIVGKTGSGKSVALTQYLSVLTDASSEKLNDLVWFVDFNTCGESGSDLQAYFVAQFNQSIEKTLDTINIGRNSVRLIVIVDSLSEIADNNIAVKEFLDSMLKLIQTGRKHKGLKILLSVNEEAWPLFNTLTEPKNIRDILWTNNELVNKDNFFYKIPPLEKRRIYSVLSRELGNSRFENQMSDELAELLQTPLFLQLFLQVQEGGASLSDETRLLYSYIQFYILSGMYAEEKLDLLNQILLHNNLSGTNTYISKPLMQNDVYREAYKELVSKGILEEKQISGKYLGFQTQVRINHRLVYTFLIANYWLRNFAFNKILLNEITVHYKGKSFLHELLYWLIKYAFIESNTDFIIAVIEWQLKGLSDIGKLDSSTVQTSLLIGDEMKKNQHLRKQLMPYYTQLIARVPQT